MVHSAFLINFAHVMKGLGKGVKNFKEGMNEVTDVTKEEKKDE